MLIPLSNLIMTIIAFFSPYSNTTTEAPVPYDDADIGFTFEMRCVITGQGQPTVTVNQNEMEVTRYEVPGRSSTAMTTAITRERITFTNTGVSTCKVDSKDTDLEVNGFGYKGRPRIAYYDSSYADIPGNTAVLPCRLPKGEEGNLTWFDNNKKEVKDNERFTKLDSGDLRIKNISIGDVGVYRCVAETKDGRDDVTTDLAII